MLAKRVTAAAGMPATEVPAAEAFATAKALRGMPTKEMEAPTGLRRLITGKGLASKGRAPKRTAPKRSRGPLRKFTILKARWRRWTIGPRPVAVESAAIVISATCRKAGAIPRARIGSRRIDCRLHVGCRPAVPAGRSRLLVPGIRD